MSLNVESLCVFVLCVLCVLYVLRVLFYMRFFFAHFHVPNLHALMFSRFGLHYIVTCSNEWKNVKLREGKCPTRRWVLPDNLFVVSKKVEKRICNGVM